MKQQEEEQEILGMLPKNQERKPNLIFKMAIVGVHYLTANDFQLL
jgi:hypothetical protein